jgi:hypothetical protein
LSIRQHRERSAIKPVKEAIDAMIHTVKKKKKPQNKEEMRRRKRLRIKKK